MSSPISAILMTIKNEENLIDFNISYHLDSGVDYIFIANHCSTDNTKKILDTYKNDKRVVVVEEIDPVFDQARIVNNLLRIANENYKIDWFLFLDADEFLSIQESSINDFIKRLEEEKIVYATIGWANALFDYTHEDYTCSPVNTIDTMKFYYPWPEKDWQEYGHFRKTIIKNHKNIEVAVGGHFIISENNPDFLGEFYWKPFIIPFKEAKLLHFEFRTSGEELFKKWERISKMEIDSLDKQNTPWGERISTINSYVEKYKNNIDGLNKKWFLQHSTFWGTEIPEDKIIYDTTLVKWYGKYFRRKIESGKVKSICLVRSSNLGDVIMSEPVASFLTKYVSNICLATDITKLQKYIGTYNKVIKFEDVFSENNDFEMAIRLIYELSDNNKTYVNGFMESVGFGDKEIFDTPILSLPDKTYNNKKYVLLAPFTSEWEKEKRNWGYDNFKTLANLIEKNLGCKCVILENSYSFDEMIDLIKNCEFFVGNDSGPSNIAFAFDKKSFVIFGATDPKYLNFSKNSIPIYDKTRHLLCNHKNRNEEIECCEPFPMKTISVDQVLEVIKNNI